jgi:hypothetical protein
MILNARKRGVHASQRIRRNFVVFFNAILLNVASVFKSGMRYTSLLDYKEAKRSLMIALPTES